MSVESLVVVGVDVLAVGVSSAAVSAIGFLSDATSTAGLGLETAGAVSEIWLSGLDLVPVTYKPRHKTSISHGSVNWEDLIKYGKHFSPKECNLVITPSTVYEPEGDTPINSI